MIGGLVITHGKLAQEFVQAARKIVGDAPRLQAVCIGWDDEVGKARAMIGTGLEALGAVDGVILFTDMFGGTPTNLSLSFLDPARIEVITGVNLPMLIKFLNLRAESTLAEAVAAVCEKGRSSIQAASGLLGSRAAKPTGSA